MAYFLPALNLDTEVPGEIEFFKRLKNDPATKNWWVLHSYFLSQHISQSQGEIDFVVFIPNRGVIVVEVKSHKKIQVRNGDFYYGVQNALGKNPFKQSYDLLNFPTSLLNINSGNCVIRISLIRNHLVLFY